MLRDGPSVRDFVVDRDENEAFDDMAGGHWLEEEARWSCIFALESFLMVPVSLPLSVCAGALALRSSVTFEDVTSFRSSSSVLLPDVIEEMLHKQSVSNFDSLSAVRSNRHVESLRQTRDAESGDKWGSLPLHVRIVKAGCRRQAAFLHCLQFGGSSACSSARSLHAQRLFFRVAAGCVILDSQARERCGRRALDEDGRRRRRLCLPRLGAQRVSTGARAGV
jgi:hypothetical protein